MELTTDFELDFENHEIAELSLTVAQPGYKVHNKIAQVVVNSYLAKAIKANPLNKDAAVQALVEARLAAEIYTSLIDIINKYVQSYREAAAEPGAPVDVTKDLDLGDNYGNPAIMDENYDW
jgi:hypothetical protein